jgi:U3 small nucleolar RNA-associated protein 22
LLFLKQQKSHLNLNTKNIKFCDKQLCSLLSLPNGIVNEYGTGEERLADACHCFNELSRLIKKLGDLPLSIVNMNGVTSTFSMTETFASLPCSFNYDSASDNSMKVRIDKHYVPRYPVGHVIVPYIKPLEVMCQLEASGKWPNDIECIKRLKTGFYIKIAQLLRDSHGVTSVAYNDYCDVSFKGFIYRLFVCTTNELLCMRSSFSDQGVLVQRDTVESLNYEKRMIHIPKLISLLYS